METIEMKIPYIKSTAPPHDVDVPKMLDLVTHRLDKWATNLSKPFTQKDAFTLLLFKEETDHVLLKYGVNRNRWEDLEGRK